MFQELYIYYIYIYLGNQSIPTPAKLHIQGNLQDDDDDDDDDVVVVVVVTFNAQVAELCVAR